MKIDSGWLARASDTDEVAELLARLVAIRSYPGEEGAAQQAVAEWLRGQGIEPELQELPDGRHNVIATVANGDGPTLVLNGHVDTVLAARGWESDPWQARRDGDRMCGLGVADMKAGVVAALLVTRALHRRPDLWRGSVVFTSVVDEEAYSVGARALVDRGVQADACIVTEPTFDALCVGGVGKVLVRIDVTGKAAHGARPEEGINAAVEAARFVARLEELPLGRHARVSGTQTVLSVHSGSEQYVITVPETARVLVTRHFVPGESGDEVLAQMRALAGSLSSPARFEIAIDPPYYPAWETDPSHPLVQRLGSAYAAEVGSAPKLIFLQGVADTNYFAADLGIPTVQFGPRGGGFHQANEWVDLPSIGTAIRVILRAALATFNG
jgi:acetylornithine deacetylase/succinyl-diaminopimelate desuccinylase-like protein